MIVSMNANVVIIGSGIAALQLAKKLSRDLNVIIFTKSSMYQRVTLIWLKAELLLLWLQMMIHINIMKIHWKRDDTITMKRAVLQ